MHCILLLAGPAHNVQMTQHRAREVMLRHALATGQEERARALLNDWRRELEDSKPLDNAGPAVAEWQRKRLAYMQALACSGPSGPAL